MQRARLRCFAAVLCTFLTGACARGEQDCPQVELSADPRIIEPGAITTEIVVVASDPNDVNNPRPIRTTLTAEGGTFEDPTASQTTYTCDPFAEGPVQICAEARFATEEADGAGDVASGADAGIAAASAYLGKPHVRIPTPNSCAKTACIDVECPENLCPVIEEFRLDQDITRPEATIFVVATDPDSRPLELVTTLSASSGHFEDPHASVTTYMCSEFGANRVELCVTASDGDEDCDQTKCGEITCNACPFLYSLSPIPSDIPPGQSSSEIQVRAEDPDNYPGPFVLTLTASSGSFDDPHAFDTFFRCDGPGVVEVCAAVDDQLCEKRTCAQLNCP